MKTLPSLSSILFSTLCAALLLIGVLPSDAKAKAVIVAVVNGEPITNLELEQRMNFFSYLADIGTDEDSRAALRRDSLQGLIDDRLKIQEALSLNPGAVQQARAEARKVSEKNFGRDGKSARLFLEEQNISQATVVERYTADILWSNVLRLRFANQLRNLDKTAEKQLQMMKNSLGETQIELSEIILLPTPQRNLEDTQLIANKMYEALEKGASFSGIAQQYSSASTASKGGKVGWLFISQIPENFRQMLIDAPANTVLTPQTVNGQVYLFRKGGQRDEGLFDPTATIVTLARAINPVSLTATEAQRASASSELADKSSTLEACDDVLKLHKELGTDLQGYLENIQMGDLSPQLQREIAALEVNRPSRPLNFTEGIVVFMVCDRAAPELGLPSVDALKQQEFERILTSLSGRYLLRLQRNARIEYK